jgi:hypothetical protein
MRGEMSIWDLLNTTKGGEVANSGAPPVLVAFGDYDAMRLQRFAAAYGGALVERWELFDPLAVCSRDLGASLIASETVAIPQ